MKEYAYESVKEVKLDLLQADFLSKKTYKEAHAHLVQFCHDILVEYKGKLLLVKRTNLPAEGTWWSLGGRVKRGVSTELSAKIKVNEESGLEVTEITFIDIARTYFQTDPFGHGKGTDTVNALYFARAEGNLVLDDLHTSPFLLSKTDYTTTFKNTLHPYMQDFIDKCMEML